MSDEPKAVDPWSHFGADMPVCPHCGAEQSDDDIEQNEGTMICDDCEKPYTYCRDFSVSWTTYKLPPEAPNA